MFIASPVLADKIAIHKASNDRIDVSAYQKELEQAEKYLSSFQTMKARFREISSDAGDINRGTITISRPGKLKVDYVSPDSMMILIKKDEIMFYDRDNDTVSYGELKHNPLDILLYKDVNLTKNVRITDIKNSATTMAVTIAPEVPKEPTEGFSEFLSITLVFNKHPLTLARIRKTDINNHSTTFSLVNQKFNIEVPDSDFPFHNPRGTLKRKKN